MRRCDRASLPLDFARRVSVIKKNDISVLGNRQSQNQLRCYSTSKKHSSSAHTHGIGFSSNPILISYFC